MKLKLLDINEVTLETKDKLCKENISLVVDNTNITPENIKKDVSILGINGTYEGSSSGGGLDINGIIEEYQVLAGENINAGDFVEFITSIYEKLNIATQSSYDPPSCILLENNKVFIAHVYGGSKYLYGTIVQINGTTMTATTTQLNSTVYSCDYAPSCILLEDNKVFIAHVYDSSNKYLYGTIVQINGTTMIPTTTKLNNRSKSSYDPPSCILLENNKVFIAHPYSSSRYLYGTIVQINGTTMTATTTQLNSASQSCLGMPSCILLENNKVFIAHVYDGSSRYLYGTIVQINGTTMTSRTTQLNNTSKSSYDTPSCILLENNKVFIAHSYTDSQYLYGAIFFNNPYVSPYNSTINGIAKTSGASGETIEVYVPN